MLKNGQISFAGNFQEIKNCQEYIEFAVATVKELTRHVKEFTEKSVAMSLLSVVLDFENVIIDQFEKDPFSLKQKSDLSDMKHMLKQASIGGTNRKVSQGLDHIFLQKTHQNKTNGQLPQEPELKNDPNPPTDRGKILNKIEPVTPDDDIPEEPVIMSNSK